MSRSWEKIVPQVKISKVSNSSINSWNSFLPHGYAMAQTTRAGLLILRLGFDMPLPEDNGGCQEIPTRVETKGGREGVTLSPAGSLGVSYTVWIGYSESEGV